MSKSIADPSATREARFQVVVADRARDGQVFLHDAPNRPMMVRAHWHREWEVNLIGRGWAEYLVGDRRVRLDVDTLVWMLPRHRHLMLDRSPDLRMWIGVFRPRLVRRMAKGQRGEDGGTLERWLGGKAPDRPPHRLLGEDAASRLGALYQRLRDPSSMSIDHHNAGLAWLMAECWAGYQGAEDLPAGSHLHPGVERAIRRLHDRPESDDLDALARDAGVSRAHLARLFREQVGCSLVDFRNRQRVRRFTELVGRGGRYTLTEAAYAAGFGSYTQCFRVVREATGRSPKALVNEVR